MSDLTTWIANVVSMVRIIGIGVVAIGILIVGMRFIFSTMFGSEHQNVVAKSGIITLIVGAVIVIGASGFLTLLYSIAVVKQP